MASNAATTHGLRDGIGRRGNRMLGSRCRGGLSVAMGDAPGPLFDSLERPSQLQISEYAARRREGYFREAGSRS